MYYNINKVVVYFLNSIIGDKVIILHDLIVSLFIDKFDNYKLYIILMGYTNVYHRQFFLVNILITYNHTIK